MTAGVLVALLGCSARVAQAQSPRSVICQFERIATAGLDDTNKIETGSDKNEGDFVLTELDSQTPRCHGEPG
jgi:hypothetical protein